MVRKKINEEKVSEDHYQKILNYKLKNEISLLLKHTSEQISPQHYQFPDKLLSNISDNNDNAFSSFDSTHLSHLSSLSPTNRYESNGINIGLCKDTTSMLRETNFESPMKIDNHVVASNRDYSDDLDGLYTVNNNDYQISLPKPQLELDISISSNIDIKTTNNTKIDGYCIGEQINTDRGFIPDLPRPTVSPTVSLSDDELDLNSCVLNYTPFLNSPTQTYLKPSIKPHTHHNGTRISSHSGMDHSDLHTFCLQDSLSLYSPLYSPHSSPETSHIRITNSLPFKNIQFKENNLNIKTNLARYHFLSPSSPDYKPPIKSLYSPPLSSPFSVNIHLGSEDSYVMPTTYSSTQIPNTPNIANNLADEEGGESGEHYIYNSQDEGIPTCGYLTPVYQGRYSYTYTSPSSTPSPSRKPPNTMKATPMSPSCQIVNLLLDKLMKDDDQWSKSLDHPLPRITFHYVDENESEIESEGESETEIESENESESENENQRENDFNVQEQDVNSNSLHLMYATDNVLSPQTSHIHSLLTNDLNRPLYIHFPDLDLDDSFDNNSLSISTSFSPLVSPSIVLQDSSTLDTHTGNHNNSFTPPTIDGFHLDSDAPLLLDNEVIEEELFSMSFDFHSTLPNNSVTHVNTVENDTNSIGSPGQFSSNALLDDHSPDTVNSSTHSCTSDSYCLDIDPLLSSSLLISTTDPSTNTIDIDYKVKYQEERNSSFDNYGLTEDNLILVNKWWEIQLYIRQLRFKKKYETEKTQDTLNSQKHNKITTNERQNSNNNNIHLPFEDLITLKNDHTQLYKENNVFSEEEFLKKGRQYHLEWMALESEREIERKLRKSKLNQTLCNSGNTSMKSEYHHNNEYSDRESNIDNLFSHTTVTDSSSHLSIISKNVSDSKIPVHILQTQKISNHNFLRFVLQFQIPPSFSSMSIDKRDNCIQSNERKYFCHESINDIGDIQYTQSIVNIVMGLSDNISNCIDRSTSTSTDSVTIKNSKYYTAPIRATVTQALLDEEPFNNLLSFCE